MPSDLNQVNLIGRLTRDPELRTTGGGTTVTTLGLATNRRRKDATGEWNDSVSFIDVTIFGKTAENVAEYMRKGSQMAISGVLEQQRWETDGQKRSKVVVIANQVQFLGSRNDSNGGDPSPAESVSVPTEDDTIPF